MIGSLLLVLADPRAVEQQIENLFCGQAARPLREQCAKALRQRARCGCG